MNFQKKHEVNLAAFANGDKTGCKKLDLSLGFKNSAKLLQACFPLKIEIGRQRGGVDRSAIHHSNSCAFKPNHGCVVVKLENTL